MTPIVLNLALRIVSEANQRGHWAKGARRASEQRAVARMALQTRLPRGVRGGVLSVLPCVVFLTRIAPRALDGDNLQRAAKAVRDGIADALGIDDRDKRVTWLYGQLRGGAKVYGVRVEVRDPDDILEQVAGR